MKGISLSADTPVAVVAVVFSVALIAQPVGAAAVVHAGTSPESSSNSLTTALNSVGDGSDKLTLATNQSQESGPAIGTEYITFWSGTLRIFAHENNTEIHLIDIATGKPIDLQNDSRINSGSLSDSTNPIQLDANESFEGVGGLGGPDDEIQVRIVAEDATGNNDSKPVTVWTGSDLRNDVKHPSGTEPPDSGNAWMSYIPAIDSNGSSTGVEIGRNFLGFTTRDMYVFAPKGQEATTINVTDLGGDGDTDDTVTLNSQLQPAASSKVIAIDLKENVTAAYCRASNIASCDGNLTVQDGTVVTGHQSLRAPENHNWRFAFQRGNRTLAESFEGSSDDATFDNQGLATVANGSFDLGTVVSGTHLEYVQDNNVVALTPSNGSPAAETTTCQQINCTGTVNTTATGKILVIANVVGKRGNNENGEHRLTVDGQTVATETEGSSDTTTSDSSTLLGVVQVDSGQHEVTINGTTARDARVQLTVIRLRHIADEVHVETCREFETCDTQFDTDGGKTWYLATTTVRAGNNDNVATELRVDGNRISETREGSSDINTWDNHYMTSIHDSDGQDNVTATHTSNDIKEWWTPQVALGYSNSEIEIYELHGFEDDSVHIESNTDISVKVGYSPTSSTDWSVTPPSHAAGDEGIELGTTFYVFSHRDLTVFPTKDNTTVTVTDLSDGDDTRTVTIEEGDLDGPYEIYTANTQEIADGTQILPREESPEVRLTDNQNSPYPSGNQTSGPFENDFVKVESDKPVLTYAGPPGSDVDEFADVAYSIPTGPAERLVYVYAQNYGNSNDLQVFGFEQNGTVNITSLTTTENFQESSHHDFRIGPGLNESALGPNREAWEQGTVDSDVWWGSGAWNGEMLRIRSTRPVTIINGDYDNPHFGAYVPFVRSTPRLPPVADVKIEGSSTVTVGEPVTFNGSDSFDQDAIEGNVTPTYEWDLDTNVDSDGDGDPTNDVDATGAVVTYTYTTEGTKSVKLTFTDDDGQSDTNSLEGQLTVSGTTTVNITSDSDAVTVKEGEIVTNSGTYVESGGDSVTLSASVGMVTKNADGTWNWSFDTSDGPDQSQSVTITAEDEDGDTDSTTFELTVENVPPTVSADAGTVTVDEGDTATNTGSFFDPGEDNVSLSASVGTVTKNADGTWNWSFDTSDGPDQSQSVTITAEDEDGDTSRTTFDLIVENVAPSVSADAGSVTVTEGQTAVTAGAFTDPGNDTVTLSASVGTAAKDGSGSWEWSFATTDGPDQSQPVIISATDEDGATGQTTFDLTVENIAPSVSATVNATDEGDSATVSASVTDPGADTHTATIDWGAGTTESVTVDQATGSLTGQQVFGDDGDYSITVTVTDDDGDSGTDTTTADVANLAPDVTLNRSGAITFDSRTFFLGRVNEIQSHTASATDPGSDDLTFAWSWSTKTTYYNDGSAPADPSLSPGGVFPFAASDTASVTFDESGVQEVAVTVTDDDGGSEAANLTKLVTGHASGTRTIGFWRHQYSDHGKPHYSDAELDAFLALSNYVSGVFSERSSASTFDAAFDTLKPDETTMRDKAEAQALAAWLNLAAGGVDWNEQIDTDGDGETDRAYNDIMQEVESILKDPDATHQELERAKDLAEAINTHDGDSGDDGGGNGNGNDNGKREGR